MNLVQRAQDILLKPKDTWPQIAAEPASVGSIYREWLLILAAIPAVASFLGLSVLGFGPMGFRVPVLTGLTQAVLSYGLSLAMCYLMALLVDALAPSFGGRKDLLSAFKLVAFASTAALLGGVFGLMPSLAILGLLAALYSIYLLYTGLPVLMQCPQDKAPAYTAVIVVAGIVAGLVVGALSAALVPRHGWGGGHFSMKTPEGEVRIDTRGIEDMAKKMEEAGKRMEAAAQKGEPVSLGGGKPVEAAALKALLPETLLDLPRKAFEAQSGGAMGIAVSSAEAKYGEGERRAELKIVDSGGLVGLAAVAGWAQITVDRETETEVEKVYKRGAHTLREKYRKDGSRAEFSLVLANGIVLELEGRGLQPAEMQQALAAIDLGKLEALQRPAP